MSSYGNHVWTEEREAAAHNLVAAALNFDDLFACVLHDIITRGDLIPVAALLAEKLASHLLAEVPDEDLGAAPFTLAWCDDCERLHARVADTADGDPLDDLIPAGHVHVNTDGCWPFRGW